MNSPLRIATASIGFCLLLLSACNSDPATDADSEQTASEASEISENKSTDTFKPDKGPEGWTELEATADECGETMSKYIDLINKYSDVYGDYAANPDDGALQLRVDELQEAAKPLQEEIDEKGQAFYAENYDQECWQIYTEAVQRMSVNVSKAAGKMIEKKMPEIQKELEEASKQLENLEY